jgi:putative ABC transport system permease protein
MMMDALLQDVRYGVRVLRKSPGFLAVAVVTLALGIGANSAIFSVVRAVLLKSLPYPDPDRVMVINEYQSHTGESSVGWPNFIDFRAQNHSMQAAAAFRRDNRILTGAGEPQLLSANEVSAPFFSILGVAPILGRTFSDAEDQGSANKTVVLSYEFWRSHMGGDPSITGRGLTLDGIPYTVVGVLPAGFAFSDRKADIYLPLGLHSNEPQWLDRGNHEGMRVIARLKDGVSPATAQNELDTIMHRLELQYPQSNSGQGAKIESLYRYRFADVEPVLYTLLGAVLCVLLIGCANVANLLQARSIGRQREFAIRSAVGAPRFRIVRQMLTESMLLGLLGGGLGLLLAPWAVAGLIKLAPQDVPRLAEARIDGGVLLYTLGISLLSGLVFGVVPALQSSRAGLSGVMKEAAQTITSGRSRHRLRAGLFVAEVALVLLLIVPCGLMLRSLLNAQAVPLGFNPDHVLALDILLPAKQYPRGQARTVFYQQVLPRLRSLPGVLSAGAVLCPPSVGQCWGSVFELSDRAVPKQSDLPSSVFNIADDDYFRTMQIALREGRYFNKRDTADSPAVVIVNQTFSRTWFPNDNALGKRVKQGFPQDDAPYREIVGVVDDVKQDGPDAEERPEVFEPITQNPAEGATLMVRTAGDPMDFAKAATAAVHSLDDKLPVSAIQPMPQYLSTSLASRKFSTLLLNLFGGLAVFLAAIGIYGVMAYSVAQRTHEIGIRMALGARPGDVLRMVVGGGMRLMAVGIGVGFVGALGATRLVRSLLFGVSVNDPVTLTSVVTLLGVVVILACAVPARRAAKVDPMVALRYE